MKRLAFLAALVSASVAAEPPAENSPEKETSSEFVGRYDGSSFETAMGMEVRADGTWGWGLSVGALDMRAKGTWKQEGEFIYFTSSPKPVKPQFEWSGLEAMAESAADAPFIRVVWGFNGEEFSLADADLKCRNGKRFYGQVYRDGYPSKILAEIEDELPVEEDPRKSCDAPETVVLIQGIHRIRSEQFNLTELGWEPGQTVRFAFHPNDLGVADFSGVTGYLEDGKLKLVGAEWPLEFRKLSPPESAVE